MDELWKVISEFADKEVEGGASEREITAVERALGVKILGGYREFLRRYGWARFAHEELLGVGSSLAKHLRVDFVTLSERTKVEPPLPTWLLPIMADGAGNHYCLDLSDSPPQEPLVVFWDHETGSADSFEHQTFAQWLIIRLDRLANPRDIKIDFDS